VTDNEEIFAYTVHRSQYDEAVADLVASRADVAELQSEVKRLEEREAELAADRFLAIKQVEKARRAACQLLCRVIAHRRTMMERPGVGWDEDDALAEEALWKSYYPWIEPDDRPMGEPGD
jgi:hypothetical protein